MNEKNNNCAYIIHIIYIPSSLVKLMSVVIFPWPARFNAITLTRYGTPGTIKMDIIKLNLYLSTHYIIVPRPFSVRVVVTALGSTISLNVVPSLRFSIVTV